MEISSCTVWPEQFDQPNERAGAIKAYATPATVGNPNPPALTNAQALVAWATAWVEATKASVVSSEAATAAAALAAPTPIATS